MNNMFYFVEQAETALVAKALSSDLRLKIIRLLVGKKLNVGEIAEALGIAQSTCVFNIKVLEGANLVKCEMTPASKGRQKICYLPYDEIVISLENSNQEEENNIIITEMPIGLYTDCKISPPCGLLSGKSIIGYVDQKDSFFNPERAKAGLIWFSKGYCEYRFPKSPFSSSQKIKSLSISLEICSEYPGFNNDWPSEITLWLNNHDIGTWLSPSDGGGERGRFTPSWWDLQNTQFGYMKTWRVTHDGSFIDGEYSSDVNVSMIDYINSEYTTLRIGIKDDAKFCGGINLFGSTFGNYEQDIRFKIEIDD